MSLLLGDEELKATRALQNHRELSTSSKAIFKLYLFEMGGARHIQTLFNETSIKEAISGASKQIIYQVFDIDSKDMTSFGRKLFLTGWMAKARDQEPTIDDVIAVNALYEIHGDTSEKVLVPEVYLPLLKSMESVEYTDEEFTDDIVSCTLPYATYITHEKLRSATLTESETK
jgi:hypothetical protein